MIFLSYLLVLPVVLKKKKMEEWIYLLFVPCSAWGSQQKKEIKKRRTASFAVMVRLDTAV